ncbi:glycosyltransferase [Malaciobacter marinus]|uniref:glycosyltransferase n=1 Tax=Malaciobacter marinus TaxID=505249 RepID=UPI003B00D23B
MKKFLYITDQDEYTDHSFIGAFFEKYLGKYFDTNILYFSEFKSDFERKDEQRFILPLKLKKDLLDELSKNGIDIDSYDYIVVRNDFDTLKHILKRKIKHNYKVGFRLSFSKRIVKLQEDEVSNKKSIFDVIGNSIKTISETNLINESDIFIPTSEHIKKEFFPNIKIKTFTIPPAIDPEVLHENIQHVEDFKRFFYAGTLDKLRDFETILKAFSQINSNQFKLSISTKDPKYAEEMLSKFPNLKNCVEIYNARTKSELLQLIAKADVGLSILPDIALFNSSTPVKILDYYSSGIPCIMTNSTNNQELFKSDNEAWFCKFDETSIKEKLEEIISLSKEEVAQIGINGQKRLLEVRNYEKISKNFALELDLL